MNCQPVISFLLIAVLAHQAILPCCMVRAVSQDAADWQDAPLRTDCCCSSCPAPPPTSGDIPVPFDDDTQEPQCPFCAGAADCDSGATARDEVRNLRPMAAGQDVFENNATSLTNVTTWLPATPQTGRRWCDGGTHLQV